MEKSGFVISPFHVSQFQEGVQFESLRVTPVGTHVETISCLQHSLQEFSKRPASLQFYAGQLHHPK
jgi:hypothetical protein